MNWEFIVACLFCITSATLVIVGTLVLMGAV